MCLQGCGGILNGTIPSSGILQWSIYTAGEMAVQITFSDWRVSKMAVQIPFSDWTVSKMAVQITFCDWTVSYSSGGVFLFRGILGLALQLCNITLLF
jgi:hypothetical protein